MALQGNQKKQGIWEKLILERVLENSGLRRNEEYFIQSTFKDGDNPMLRPDVIVHLPEGRSVIVDSQVSLTSWERFCTSTDDDAKKGHLKDHITSLRRHIKGLSEKNDPAINRVNSLDFVLLFMPIDATVAEACAVVPTLCAEAYEQHIIVTPTTLLVTSRTIKKLRRNGRQNQNAAEIAFSAGQLYDKICNFLEDMEKIGRQFSTCQTTYQMAMNKLCQGHGNMVAQAQKLADMGIPTKKVSAEKRQHTR